MEELFGGVPRVLIRVNVRTMQTTKLKSTENTLEQPVKKPKTATSHHDKSVIPGKKPTSNFQSILKNIKKDKKPVSPSTLAPTQPVSTRPAQPASQSLKDLINDFKQFKEQQGESGFSKPKETEPQKEANADGKKADPNLEYKQLSQYRLERVGLKQESGFEGKKRHGDGLLEEPVKRSRHEEILPEGRFSSDSEELPEPKAAEKSEEYSVLDFAHRDTTRRNKKKKGKMYDPLQTAAPKNKAPIGSLLRIWTGKIEYNKTSMMVDMFSIDNIELFQRVMQLPSKLEIQGRTKQDELEAYLTQSTGAGTHKVIITAWLEAGPGYEFAFRALSRDLAEKDRAAVIRNDSALSIYITCLTESFKSALNSLKINVLQKVDKTISQHISEREKLACILVYKKSAAGPASSLLDPTVLLAADVSQTNETEEDKAQEQPLSPITSDEEDQQTDASLMVQTIISKLERGEKLGREDLSKLRMIAEENPSPELSNLIATINMQIEQPREERAEDNVAQFLSQQHGAPKPQARYGYDQKRSSRFS